MTHRGITIAGLNKPMAVGTCTWSDAQSTTGRFAPFRSSVRRSRASRLAASTGIQLVRSTCRCHTPRPTPIKCHAAIAAQAAKTYIAQEPGSVTADALLRLVFPARVHAVPMKGSVAIAMSAANHTAKRAPEFCRRTAFKSRPAKIAIRVPSTRHSSIRTDELWAIAFKSDIIGSLTPFQ